MKSHDLKISQRESIDESRCTRPRSRKCIEEQMKERRKRERERERKKGKSVESHVLQQPTKYLPTRFPRHEGCHVTVFLKWRDVTRPGLYANTFYPSSFVLVLYLPEYRGADRVLRARRGKSLSRNARSGVTERRQLVKANKTVSPQSIRSHFLRKIEYNGLVNYERVNYS